jgi:hypothetical protein
VKIFSILCFRERLSFPFLHISFRSNCIGFFEDTKRRQGLADFYCFHWGCSSLGRPHQASLAQPNKSYEASRQDPRTHCTAPPQMRHFNRFPFPSCLYLIIIISKYLFLSIHFRVQSSRESCRLANLNSPKAWTPWYRSSNTRVLHKSVSLRRTLHADEFYHLSRSRTVCVETSL